MKCVVAIDQGTTGSTVLLINEALTIVGRGYSEYAQIYPQPGWVEHDPEAIWASVQTALQHALQSARVPPDDIVAVGITNQRETTLLWERATGRPLHNAIVWQDRRTADACAAKAPHAETVRARTGLPIDPYFSATKLAWLLDHVPGARARASRGELAFGTVDSYLVWRLSGGSAHVTDVSNASRTMLFDIGTLAWSPAQCALFDIPSELLPQVVASSGVIASIRGISGLRDGTPIAGVAGDQQAALFGQACFAPGAAKCTYGTGAFILMHTGGVPVPSKSRLITTVAWQLHGARAEYALEGSAFIAGAAVQWLRDGLGFFTSAKEIEALAAQVPDSGGVVVVPALAGLGAPHWRPDARGLIAGLSRGSTRAHIARATLEGIALQNVELLRAMEQDSGQRLSVLRVDGGAAANNLLMQIQADVLGVAISRPEVVETTALGAACLAGLGVGLWPSQASVTNAWRQERLFTPTPDPAARARAAALVRAYEVAVKKA